MRKRGYWPPRGSDGFQHAARTLRPQVRKSCKHLGEFTGQMVYCPPCSEQGQRTELKVLACAVHGSCTVGRKVDGQQCCAMCPDWEARQ